MEVNLKIIENFAAHTDRCWSVDWSPNGQLLSSSGGDKCAKIWGKDNQVITSLNESRTIRKIKFAPDGNKLATCSFNGKVQIYELDNGQWESSAELEGHESEVKSISWSADGNLLATCGRDKSVWIWECWEEGDYECSAVLTSHSADVKDVIFHPYDPILISASYDMTIKVYKEIDSEWDCIQTIVGHTDTVWAVDWSPDGKRIASVGSDNCLRIWKQNDGKYELERNVQGEHERNIYSVNWSERGILTGSGDNKIRLFVEQDDQSWICTKTIELRADINSVAWCRDNKRAAAGTDDGEVIILEVE